MALATPCRLKFSSTQNSSISRKSRSNIKGFSGRLIWCRMAKPQTFPSASADNFLTGIIPDGEQVIPELVTETGLEDVRFIGYVQVIDLTAQQVDGWEIRLPGKANGDRNRLMTFRRSVFAAYQPIGT